MYYTSSPNETKRRTLTSSEEAFLQWVHYSPTPKAMPSGTATGPERCELLLRQNTPNPFNPETALRFELAQPAVATVQVVNTAGQTVRTLMRARALPAGEHSLFWDGADDTGRELGSGVYFWRVRTGTATQAARMTLVR